MDIVIEPNRTTPPELRDVLDELSRLEPIFHWPPAAMTRSNLEAMVVDDFWEVGASGRRYSRAFVLSEVQKRQVKNPPDVYKASDFHVRPLAPDVFLLTYTLLQDGTRLTRRSSIWQRAAKGWQCIYHQGTVAEAP